MAAVSVKRSISFYSRVYVHIIYEKTKGQVPLGPLLGKQSIQAKEVYLISSYTFLRNFVSGGGVPEQVSRPSIHRQCIGSATAGLPHVRTLSLFLIFFFLSSWSGKNQSPGV